LRSSDNIIKKRTAKGSPLWRIAGYIYETVISGSVTIFSAKGSSLIPEHFFLVVRGIKLIIVFIINPAYNYPSLIP